MTQTYDINIYKPKKQTSLEFFVIII